MAFPEALPPLFLIIEPQQPQKQINILFEISFPYRHVDVLTFMSIVIQLFFRKNAVMNIVPIK